MTIKQLAQAIVREIMDLYHGIPHLHDCTIMKHKSWPVADHRTVIKHACPCGNTWTTTIHDSEWSRA